MRPHSDISLQLGILKNEYTNKRKQGTISNDFSIYETFHNPAVHDKSYLRALAKKRGQIDALQYAISNDTKHLPTDWQWIQPTPEQTLRHTAEAYSEANHGGEGNTWIDYLRGWNTALQFVLDDEERPWDSRCYHRPQKHS